IVDSQITDYWWDGTQLRELQTYQPDLSNVVSSLGTATGGGNAITDLSLTGNILIPAKNKSFVDVDNDQSITGQKSFTTTIHSVGITYQDYNNSNVILAGGGVRAIADIQSASYSKAEDDSKLTLMTDKIELIDAYTKTESDSKFVDMTTDQTIGGNIIFNLEVRAPNSKLPGYSSDYVVMSGAMNNKSHFELTDEVDQTVAGIKIFSNNITAPAFIKSDGTNQQVLLANGTTKPLSEFTTTIDDSNYVNKMVMYYDYITLGAVKMEFVSSIYCGSISGNLTATSFIKSGGTNQQVLLANGITKLLFEFSGGSIDDSNYVKKTGQYWKLWIRVHIEKWLINIINRWKINIIIR
ncbi:MAG: hypothetical protein EZS28_030264, partial [Streblomastix strix]